MTERHVGQSFNATFNADGSFYVEYCDDYKAQNFCFSISSDLNSTECGITIDNVSCKSCEIEDETCLVASADQNCCGIFDCTNTDLALKGNTCDLDLGLTLDARRHLHQMLLRRCHLTLVPEAVMQPRRPLLSLLRPRRGWLPLATRQDYPPFLLVVHEWPCPLACLSVRPQWLFRLGVLIV
jgi:hypothetical protein